MVEENKIQQQVQQNSIQEKKSKRKTWLVVTIVIVVLILLLSCLGIIAGIYFIKTGKKAPGINNVFNGDAVALIRLEGVISGDGYGGMMGEGGIDPETFADDIQEAVDDDDVKAIVIRVNSPGGSPAASQEMYEEVKRAAEEKPVVASVSDVAASGSYYAISPVDEIIASRASDIGSIGVFIEVPNLEELYKKLGIKMTIIKEGKYKTMGDPSKALTNEEKAILQDYAKEVYNQFIDDVAKARKKLSKKEVRKLATGRTWPASQAKDLGLIDSFGNLQDAIDRAAKLGKIKGEPEVIDYYDYDWLSSIDQGIKALGNIGKFPQATKSFK